MDSKSIKFAVPDVRPYDQPDSWFETFIGVNLRPLLESGLLTRFWFTRYGAVAHDKHAMFCFDTTDLESVQKYIDEIIGTLPITVADNTDYNASDDIGHGQNSRFLGSNARHSDQARRGDIAFDWLHASARLFPDALTVPDKDGYCRLEAETTSGFNIETSLEQYHHLFCNMTAVPAFVVVAEHKHSPGKCQVMSMIHFAQIQKQDSDWQAVSRVRGDSETMPQSAA